MGRAEAGRKSDRIMGYLTGSWAVKLNSGARRKARGRGVMCKKKHWMTTRRGSESKIKARR